ncbi:MAG TPA: hypothetical protein VF273_04885 [Pelobium sp.]
MKNSTKIIGALSAIIFLSFACKKEKETTRIDGEQKYAVSIQKGNFSDKPESAVLIGTKASLETTFDGKKDVIYLKKISAKNNVFIDVTGTVDPLDPKNPIDLCWDEINAYYQQHYQEWQATANQNCKPFITCITCPKANAGLFVLYVIKPNSAKCNIAEAVSVMYNFNKFDFGSDDYDTEAVSAYINAKK